ncbi:MAG: hypothetical protein ABJZ55_13170 [Fuerstiella sp.]
MTDALRLSPLGVFFSLQVATVFYVAVFFVAVFFVAVSYVAVSYAELFFVELFFAAVVRQHGVSAELFCQRFAAIRDQ